MTATAVPAAPVVRPHDKANIVEVDELKVHFPIRGGVFRSEKGAVKAVDGVTFEVRRGETLGLVGESGCGKSTIGRAMIRLRIPTEGSVRFDGQDLALLSTKELRRMRRRMQIIFQDPYGSLDPRMTVSAIIAEPIETHKLASGRCEARADRRAAPAGRSRPDVRQPLPARVLGWPAPAHRGGPGARRRAGVHRLRRTDLRPRRVDPGPGPQPADAT